MKFKLSQNIYFDNERDCIIINGKTYAIEKKQSDLLVFFINNENIVLSKEYILNSVWGSVVSIQVVTQAIFKLRRLFKEQDLECPIITVQQKGYIYDPSILESTSDVRRKFILNKINFVIVIIIFVFIGVMIKKIIDNYEINKMCSVINCRNLVYLNVSDMNSSEEGFLRLIKIHLKINHNINLSSTELAYKLSSRHLNFNFNDKYIEYIDNELKSDSFKFTYFDSIDKEDYWNLMVKLDESVLIKNKHKDLKSLYNELPSNKEAFNLLLSSLDGSSHIFSKENIKKLELAGDIEPDNQYIISLKYMMSIFYIYDNFHDIKKRNKLIAKLNEKFFYDVSRLDGDNISPKMNEAYAAYYLTKNQPYKSLEFILKTKSNEKTIIGMLLNAKINEALNNKSYSDSIYKFLSVNVNKRVFSTMMNSFN
ncbi:winged helix-turn-helix domain-containing protein [Aliivibrio fischeri]|uniref:winged helix-turn-helix domain-containing protein n=1 Tax=Aliivibrio fischeri TaxID=668 RepID=UPI0012D878FF|nr:winged helix-turn-helix domain-containing protein [Aliivibrio fischeri]MUJ19691.1 hypothetical protein [Aliivibrio fischeri]